MKTGVKCKVKKGLFQFSKRSAAADKLDSYCKICRNAISANYESKNKLRRSTYVKHRRDTDPNIKIANNLRNNLRFHIIGAKNGSAIESLGCSVQDLRIYLESLWTKGMTWDNYGNGYGKWNIDHIYPLSMIDLSLKENILKVCHYSNLRPMWAIANIQKSNRIEQEVILYNEAITIA